MCYLLRIKNFNLYLKMCDLKKFKIKFLNIISKLKFNFTLVLY